MDLVNSYFGKTVFEKVDQKEGYIIYAARISSSLGDGKKQYILAFVPIQHAIKNKAYLFELPWQNLQTRLMKNGYRLIQQKWDIPKDIQQLLLNRVERTDQYTSYRSDEFEMILLHDMRKKSKYQYYDRMDLLTSLNTFNCILNYTFTKNPLFYTKDIEEMEYVEF